MALLKLTNKQVLINAIIKLMTEEKAKESDPGESLISFATKLGTAIDEYGLKLKADPTGTKGLVTEAQLNIILNQVILGINNSLTTKQDDIILTTLGSSGESTFDGTTLNIPNYSGTSNPSSTTLYINKRISIAEQREYTIPSNVTVFSVLLNKAPLYIIDEFTHTLGGNLIINNAILINDNDEIYIEGTLPSVETIFVSKFTYTSGAQEFILPGNRVISVYLNKAPLYEVSEYNISGNTLIIYPSLVENDEIYVIGINNN